MPLRHPLLCCSVLLLLSLWHLPAAAGMLGFPVPRQKPWQPRFELAGDSFLETFDTSGSPEASSGRALGTVALGLTPWSEIYGRFGVAEFNFDAALFSGDFGFAYGGGVRLRLLPLPFGTIGASGQYLRFTSNDNDSAGTRIDGEWEEYDVALGLGTRRFGGFEFYGGGAYHQSEIRLKVINSGLRHTLTSETPFRLFLGAYFYPLADIPSGNFAVFYEIRFIGETPQFTLGVQYAF